MPNLVGSVAAVVADAALGADGADAGVDAQADRAPAIPPPVAVDLAQQIEVHVHAVLEHHVEVAVAHVGAGVADLGGREAVGEAVLDLARRADVEADELRRAGRAEPADARQHFGLALALERPADLPGQAGARHRPLQGAHVLLDVGEVVDEQRRAVLAGQHLGVAAGDEQAAVTGLEARPLPPVARVVVGGVVMSPVSVVAAPWARRRVSRGAGLARKPAAAAGLTAAPWWAESPATAPPVRRRATL